MGEENIITNVTNWLHGEDKAFEIVFLHYHPRLCRYASKYLRHRDWSEDLAMEVLAKVWQKRDAISSANTFENYLFAIARNCLITEWQKKIDTMLCLEMVDNELCLTDPDLSAFKELKETYRESLSGLPEQRRKIFLMHREEHLTYKEIADQLNISPKTVENQVGATLKHLRTSLAQHLASIFL